MKALIFSDVNGVVAVNARSTVFNHFKKAKVDHGYIIYSPAVVDFFNKHASHIKWLTTWGDLAQTRLAPALGISAEIEVQEDTIGQGMTHYFSEPNVSKGNWWKINEVIIALDADENQKVAWIDDNLTQVVQTALEEKYGSRVLLIATDPAVGITQEHLEQLETFLN